MPRPNAYPSYIVTLVLRGEAYIVVEDAPTKEFAIQAAIDRDLSPYIQIEVDRVAELEDVPDD